MAKAKIQVNTLLESAKAYPEFTQLVNLRLSKTQVRFEDRQFFVFEILDDLKAALELKIRDSEPLTAEELNAIVISTIQEMISNENI
jgi:hypothetical protein